MSKIIIAGGGTKQRFFKDDKKAEIWACNGQFCGHLSWLPRVDRAFNLHRFKLLREYGYDFNNEVEYFRENYTVPFITMDKWPRQFIPNYASWSRLPYEKMRENMPRGMYHCGSFDWMVALAIFIGKKEIKLHGVNLNLEATEPMAAQACLEYWCGYAEGKGIKITQAEDCSLFVYTQKRISSITYGIDDAPIYIDDRKGGMGSYDYRP